MATKQTTRQVHFWLTVVFPYRVYKTYVYRDVLKSGQDSTFVCVLMRHITAWIMYATYAWQLIWLQKVWLLRDREGRWERERRTAKKHGEDSVTTNLVSKVIRAVPSTNRADGPGDEIVWQLKRRQLRCRWERERNKGRNRHKPEFTCVYIHHTTIESHR